jgi:hypothetical protein
MMPQRKVPEDNEGSTASDDEPGQAEGVEDNRQNDRVICVPDQDAAVHSTTLSEINRGVQTGHRSSGAAMGSKLHERISMSRAAVDVDGALPSAGSRQTAHKNSSGKQSGALQSHAGLPPLGNCSLLQDRPAVRANEADGHGAARALTAAANASAQSVATDGGAAARSSNVFRPLTEGEQCHFDAKKLNHGENFIEEIFGLGLIEYCSLQKVIKAHPAPDEERIQNGLGRHPCTKRNGQARIESFPFSRFPPQDALGMAIRYIRGDPEESSMPGKRTTDSDTAGADNRKRARGSLTPHEQ